MPQAIRNYALVVGAILSVLVVGAVATKPKLSDMREGVNKGLEAYAVAHLAGETVAARLMAIEERDWLLAVSYSAKLGEQTFSCFGAFHVTVCLLPD